MTADIVNLRRARKARARASEAARAAENRARFGRASAERQAAAEADARAARRLDGHQLRGDRVDIDGLDNPRPEARGPRIADPAADEA